jgi:PAS domain-containing protein
VADTGTGIAPTSCRGCLNVFTASRAHAHGPTKVPASAWRWHDLVLLHGGRIAVEPPGRGTVFSVMLPLGSSHLPQSQLGAPAAPLASIVAAYVAEAESWGASSAPLAEVVAAGAMRPAQHGRLLVVDDNADMRDYLQRRCSTVAGGAVQQRRRGAGRRGTPAARPDRVRCDDAAAGRLWRWRQRPSPPRAIFRSCCCPRAPARKRGWKPGRPAPTIIWSSHSPGVNWWRASRCCVRQRMRAVEDKAVRRLRSVFSQAPVAIAILNGPEHVFEQANDYYQQLVGNRPLLGHTIGRPSGTRDAGHL